MIYIYFITKLRKLWILFCKQIYNQFHSKIILQKLILYIFDGYNRKIRETYTYYKDVFVIQIRQNYLYVRILLCMQITDKIWF